MAMQPVTPPYGSAGQGGGGGRVGDDMAGSALRAWLYEVQPDGISHAMADPLYGRKLQAGIGVGGTLYVSVEGGQNTATRRYLKAPPADGMSSSPVRVNLDDETGFWVIQNSGRTNTLRVQQYGLPAVPLRPQSSMPMSARDVAVWIPVVPNSSKSDKSESFRLLVLCGTEQSPGAAQRQRDGQAAPVTRFITGPRRHLSDFKQEALLAYFGDHLSWPPLPAPHVRQQAEVEELASQWGLRKEPNPKLWARNRFDVLAGKDGLFTDADWYPRLGGAGRTLANHLAAFNRLVELGTINLRRVREWAAKYNVEPYVRFDKDLPER
jgi:hypothetical protein